MADDRRKGIPMLMRQPLAGSGDESASQEAGTLPTHYLVISAWPANHRKNLDPKENS